MKKKIVIISIIIIVSAVVAVFTVSAIDANKEEPTTYLAGERNADVIKTEYRDVDPDAWFYEYYIKLQTLYVKTGNEKADALVDTMHERISEFYDQIKHGVTDKEYAEAEKEIYSIASEIDSVLISSGAKESNRSSSYNYADAKMKEIREQLDQYIMEWEWIKENERGGNSSTTRAKLKKAYEFDEELKIEEKKLENREYTVEEANKLIDDMYMKYFAVSSNVGTGSAQ